MHLARLRMLSCNTLETAHGVAWVGLLALDGKPFAQVENDGNGGCNTYHLPPEPCADPAAAHAEMRRTINKLEQACRKECPWLIEALDAFTSCMEPGDSADDVIRLVKEMFAL